MSEIVPYVKDVDTGLYSIPDSVMVKIYEKIVDQKLNRWVFFDGKVRSSIDWLSLCKNSGNVLQITWNDDIPVVVSWLNSFGKNHAHAHFCCFKEIWGKHTVEFARNIIKYWFSFNDHKNEPLLDTIIGQTPENNKMASKFLYNIGMQVLGVIPNIEYDVYDNKKVGIIVSYIMRKEL